MCSEITLVDGDLAGCSKGPIGDPLSYVPSVWSGLIETFEPQSILDLGCGLGYSLLWFRDRGIEACGLDGSSLVLREAITPVDFWDARTPVPYDTPCWDLCWCSEFVEHLDERYVSHILDMFRHAHFVAMTAGYPGQRGHHHVNCQPRSYWINAMESSGFLYLSTVTNWLRAIANEAHPWSYFGTTGMVFERC